MSTQAERDEIFHQSVVDIIMRFTPEKKNIVVPPECLKELKDIVRAKVNPTNSNLNGPFGRATRPSDLTAQKAGQNSFFFYFFSFFVNVNV